MKQILYIQVFYKKIFQKKRFAGREFFIEWVIMDFVVYLYICAHGRIFVVLLKMRGIPRPICAPSMDRYCHGVVSPSLRRRSDSEGTSFEGALFFLLAADFILSQAK